MPKGMPPLSEEFYGYLLRPQPGQHRRHAKHLPQGFMAALLNVFETNLCPILTEAYVHLPVHMEETYTNCHASPFLRNAAVSSQVTG